jgi:hypothetical protein
MGQLVAERNKVGTLTPETTQRACVLALLSVIVGGCVIKKSTAGATPCTDVEVTPSHAAVIRCADSQNNMTGILHDASGRVVSYQFDVSCSDGRRHTGSVGFGYANAMDPGKILTMFVDGGSCVNSTSADASVSSGSGGSGAPNAGGVMGSGGAHGSSSVGSGGEPSSGGVTGLGGTRSAGGGTGGVIGSGGAHVSGGVTGSGGALNSGGITGSACAEHDVCFDSTSVDGDQIASWKTPGGYESTVTTAAGRRYRVLWEENATDGGPPSLAFTLQVPSGETLGTIDLGAISTDAEGTATAGLYVARLFDSAPPSDVTAAPDSGALMDYAFSGSNPSQWSNTAGCDTIHGCDCASSGACANRGACCDWHDECITANCGVNAANGINRGSGNAAAFLVEYLVAVLATGSTTKCTKLTGCEACHCGVMQCFLAGRLGSAPARGVMMPVAGPMPSVGVLFGPSSCCSQKSICTPGKKNSCGDKQQCMIDGGVIVDPYICQQHNYTSLGCGDAGAGGPSTCTPGGAADLENPVGSYVFEFVGDDYAGNSEDGGYQTHYDLLVGADLKSNLVGLESYTVRSVALKIDVEYTSTPQCIDSNTGQPVACKSQLKECIPATFVTDDFDLTGATFIHEAKGSASNPIPDDFYDFQFALAGGKVFSTASRTSIQYASGTQLLLGTANDSGYHEGGYFHSKLILPAPYVQLGISPGEPILGQASIKARDAGVGP